MPVSPQQPIQIGAVQAVVTAGGKSRHCLITPAHSQQMLSVAPAQRPARGLLVLVTGVPDHGAEFAVISPCGPAEIGLELLRSELGAAIERLT